MAQLVQPHENAEHCKDEKTGAQTSPQKQNKLENTEASDEINSYLYINALDKELFLIVRRNNNMQYKDINI